MNLPTARNADSAFIDPVTATGVQEILFPNARSYTSYRITFEDVRDADAANSLQIGEIELLGTVGESTVPELEVTRNANGSLTITSTVDGTLQSTAELGANADWNDVGPISGSVTVNADEDAQFYRVVAAE